MFKIVNATLLVLCLIGSINITAARVPHEHDKHRTNKYYFNTFLQIPAGVELHEANFLYPQELKDFREAVLNHTDEHSIQLLTDYHPKGLDFPPLITIEFSQKKGGGLDKFTSFIPRVKVPKNRDPERTQLYAEFKKDLLNRAILLAACADNAYKGSPLCCGENFLKGFTVIVKRVPFQPDLQQLQ